MAFIYRIRNKVTGKFVTKARFYESEKGSGNWHEESRYGNTWNSMSGVIQHMKWAVFHESYGSNYELVKYELKEVETTPCNTVIDTLFRK
jgi:hypothetical protein